MDSEALEGVQLLKFALNFASAEPRGVAETCGQLLETFSSRERGRGLPDGDLFPDLRKLIKERRTLCNSEMPHGDNLEIRLALLESAAGA